MHAWECHWTKTIIRKDVVDREQLETVTTAMEDTTKSRWTETGDRLCEQSIKQRLLASTETSARPMPNEDAADLISTLQRSSHHHHTAWIPELDLCVFNTGYRDSRSNLDRLRHFVCRWDRRVKHGRMTTAQPLPSMEVCRRDCGREMLNVCVLCRSQWRILEAALQYSVLIEQNSYERCCFSLLAVYLCKYLRWSYTCRSICYA